MGKKGKKGQRRSGGSGGSGAASPRKFTAPTPGLEDVIFTWGTAKDGARFEETVNSLARHVGTQGWKYSSVALKAMSQLAPHIITAPNRPVREYWADTARTTRTNNGMSSADPPVAHAPVKEDWDHGIDVENYKVERKAFQEQEAAWKENRAKCYYLVLSHCPKELETDRRSSATQASGRRRRATRTWSLSS